LDVCQPYSLVVGNSACWQRGSLFPTGQTPWAARENAWCGNNLTASGKCQATADYLDHRFTKCHRGRGSLNLTTVQEAYIGLSAEWAATQANCHASTNSMLYPGGLWFDCDNPSAKRYYVKIGISTWNANSWYVLGNCNAAAEWIITLYDDNPQRPGVEVQFFGAEFPGVSERIVYNIVDCNPVYVEGCVRGSILAPQSNYNQPTSGVTRGFLIANNIENLHQANRPVCNQCDCCNICAAPSAASPSAPAAGNPNPNPPPPSHKSSPPPPPPPSKPKTYSPPVLTYADFKQTQNEEDVEDIIEKLSAHLDDAAFTAAKLKQAEMKHKNEETNMKAGKIFNNMKNYKSLGNKNY